MYQLWPLKIKKREYKMTLPVVLKESDKIILIILIIFIGVITNSYLERLYFQERFSEKEM